MLLLIPIALPLLAPPQRSVIPPERASTIEFAQLREALPPYDSPNPPLAALVDWDADGAPDILRGQIDSSTSGGRVELLLNDGQARFRTVWSLPRRVTLVPRIGDLDGDGRPDAWVGDGLDSTILRNDGAGGFTLQPSALRPPLALADLDGDGHLDWLARTHVGFVQDLRWARNRGDATFEPEIALGVDLSFGGFAVADLDADGHADLAHVLNAGGFGQRGLELLFNDGSGGFAQRSVLALRGSQYGGPLAAADVNGDGLADLLLADPRTFSPRRVLQYRNLGGRQYQDVSVGMPLAASVTALTPADLDGDGALDLFLGRELLLNDGTGTFRLAPAASGQAFGGLFVEADDLDGDGDADVLLADRSQVLLGDGTGALLVAGGTPPLQGPAALGDLDGDGWLDALACPEGFPSCDAHFNDGRGVLVRTPDTLTPELWTGTWRLGDLDGDGDLDCLQDGSDEAGRNDGSGSFSPYSVGVLPWGIDGALGDLDGDGDLDAFYARASSIHCHFGPCYLPGPDALFLNDGGGLFTDGSARFTSFTYVGLAVALADLEGDGDLDVLTSARVLQNDGAGRLVDGNLLWTTFVKDLATGDVDADGDVDVVIGGDPDQLARNDGSGGFTPPEDVPGASLRLALADVDEDLDLDVLASRAGTPGEFVVLRNDGPSFAAVPQVGLLRGELAVGDLDRDGDPDLLDGQRVWFNQHRSLAYRGVPRIGQSLTLDLRGSPLRGFVLAASRGLAPQLTGPYGLRQLAPDQITRIFFGLFDGGGRAEVTLAIPRLATLVDAQWHWQALVSSPVRWSGRETTSLVGF